MKYFAAVHGNRSSFCPIYAWRASLTRIIADSSGMWREKREYLPTFSFINTSNERREWRARSKKKKTIQRTAELIVSLISVWILAFLYAVQSLFVREFYSHGKRCSAYSPINAIFGLDRDGKRIRLSPQPTGWENYFNCFKYAFLSFSIIIFLLFAQTIRNSWPLKTQFQI